MKLRDHPERLLILQRDRCRGCTHCLRVCPTEAIRIRSGKAEVMPHRCIECGKCIQVCPQNAWRVQTEASRKIREGASTVLLDPAVLWQFGDSFQGVTAAFRDLGFTSVEDMGEALEVYAAATSSYLSSGKGPRPAIASFCPAVVQLVQVRYPSLLENLLPIISPYEIAVKRLYDREGEKRSGLLYGVVPCLAQASALRTPSLKDKFHGVIPLADVYNPVKAAISRKRDISGETWEAVSFLGMKWATAGGQSEALGKGVSLIVDDIHRVAGVLELAENGLLEEVSFIEAWACQTGCLGGPLTVQNAFVARYHLLQWLQKERKYRRPKRRGNTEPFVRKQAIPARPGMRLDENLQRAMEKLHRIDEVVKKLPGIDCGSCGCPNCLALAEDVVQGRAQRNDCVYVVRRGRAQHQAGRPGSGKGPRKP